MRAGCITGATPNIIVEALARLRAGGMPEAAKAKILLVGSFDAKTGLNQALYERRSGKAGWRCGRR